MKARGSHFPFHHPHDENWVTGYSLHRDGITPKGTLIQIMKEMGLETGRTVNSLIEDV
jgi:predicted RNA binding protein YcfA (HicA-like mRNA interferase family)